MRAQVHWNTDNTVRERVVWSYFEGGPGSDAEGGNWTVVHRASGPPAEKTGEGKSEGVREAAQLTGGFDVVVAADAQAVSDRSRRVYGEPPPLAGPGTYRPPRQPAHFELSSLWLYGALRRGDQYLPGSGRYRSSRHPRHFEPSSVTLYEIL